MDESSESEFTGAPSFLKDGWRPMIMAAAKRTERNEGSEELGLDGPLYLEKLRGFRGLEVSAGVQWLNSSCQSRPHGVERGLDRLFRSDNRINALHRTVG